ncbi:serine hydrolase FSH [Penicillium riverlandense]|uniref:serine hydrolase FSH n=1 Tax=Penicillium riverlandense TaxID=1903569 RepID=UPI00254742B6|nr:serine hydrolase FSH [Penicillium riverlandense]KAJ5825487.1 serine hydrolase FSH [Penicillium riverlandense]
MTILCLHGSYGSAAKFKVQLGTLVDAVEKALPGGFKWIDGGHTTMPPDNFASYFGPPPYFRFFEFDGVGAMDNLVMMLRGFPSGVSAEDTIRKLIKEEEMPRLQAVQSTVDRIFKIIDEDPSIDGLFGYSEGATLAATLVLEERRRAEEEGRPRRIKYAVFLAGWPPARLNPSTNSVECVLADECLDVIDVPTCHIIGSNDPYIHGAMALYSVCDADTSVLFDHGKGHTVPRDAQTIEELAEVIVSVRREGEKLSS